MHSCTHEGVVLPSRVLKPPIFRVRRQFTLPRHDLDHVFAHRLAMLHEPLGIRCSFTQHDRNRPEYILSRQADQWTESGGVLDGFVFKLGHVRVLVSSDLGGVGRY